MYPPLVPALVVQQRQTDREVTVYRLIGLYHTVRQYLVSIRVKQLSVALPCFVWNEWGDDHWFSSQ